MSACDYPQSPITINLPVPTNIISLQQIILGWNDSLGTLFLKEQDGGGSFLYGDFSKENPPSTTTLRNPTIQGNQDVIYQLKSLHVHHPGEHFFSLSTAPIPFNFRYDGEIHIVSKAKINGIDSGFVFAVLFQIDDSAENSVITAKNAVSISVAIAFGNPFHILAIPVTSNGLLNIATYDGSLTTPIDATCCPGPVKWNVILNPILLTTAFFNTIFPSQPNARPLQDNNNIVVSSFNWMPNNNP